MDTFTLNKFVKVEDKINLQRSDLTISIGDKGFSFSIVDAQSNVLMILGEFIVNLSGSITDVMSAMKKCFNSINFHLFTFNTVKVVLSTQKNVFVPIQLYNKQLTKDYLRQVCTINNNETILDSISERLNLVSIFATKMYQQSGIKILLPKANFVSTQQVMSQYCYEISKLSGNTAIIHKREKSFDFIIYRKTEFLFSNSFTFDSEQDMLYNILFVFEKLEIDTSLVTLLITGDDYSVEEKQLLKKYVRNVSFANPNECVRIGSEFDGINLQNYFLTLAR